MKTNKSKKSDNELLRDLAISDNLQYCQMIRPSR